MIRIVGHVDRRQMVVTVDLLQQVHDPASRIKIKASRRLVGQKKIGSSDEGASQNDPLLFTAGQFAPQVLCSAFQPDLRKTAAGLAQSHGTILAANQEGHPYVLFGRKFRKQSTKLPNESDLAVSNKG